MSNEPLPAIKFEDFAKLDLRVATVLSAEPHPNADKLLKIRLDDGTPEGRQVCAGIRAWYDPATLVGKQVIIVANLEPRQLRGEVSQGMILAASDLKPLAEVVATSDDAAAGGATVGGAAVGGGRPATAKPSDDERDVVVLSVQKPVKAGSRVS
jgi:methionine--tRNA ligase beta chain